MHGARVLLSEATATETTMGRFRQLDRVIAKGKTEPMSLYEVLDADPPALKTAKEKQLATFAQATAFLHAGQFQKAAEGFAVVVVAVPEDHAAAALALGCAGLAKDPPANWDGATRLVEK